MSYNRPYNNGKGHIQLNSIRQLRQVLLSDNNPTVQLIRHFLLIQIALPIKAADLIQLRWEHIYINDPSVMVYKRGRESTSLAPCFYPITGEIVSYLNGLRQQCSDPFYVFGSLAQMDTKQRNRLISDYIKKSGVRLSIDLKYLHCFFGEYADESYFVPQFVASFIRGENTLAYSQKLARHALIEWWGEKTSIVVCNE